MSSTFNYSQYQQIAAQEQANASGDGTKVGYFRLKDDGDIAIARINISSTDEFMFAAVHTINAGGKWIKVSCHNPLGMNAAGCALCSASQANPKGSVNKSTKKMYIPMVVSYRDPQTHIVNYRRRRWFCIFDGEVFDLLGFAEVENALVGFEMKRYCEDNGLEMSLPLSLYFGELAKHTWLQERVATFDVLVTPSQAELDIDAGD